MPHYRADDGTTLSYSRSGAGAPLICLPGGPLRDPVYLGDLGGLSRHREVIIPELRKTRVDHLVADIEALRRELGLEQPDLLAHSAGANLALLYAAAHPARIGRLVLVTPSCAAVDLEVSDEEWDATLAKRSAEPWFAAAHAALEALFEGAATAEGRLAAARLWHGPWTDRVEAFCAAEEQQRTPNAIKIYYPEDALHPAATIEALQKLAAPTLVLAGDLDPMCTLGVARELAGMFPDAALTVLPGCGHAPWVEFPEQFIKAVTSFLAQKEEIAP